MKIREPSDPDDAQKGEIDLFFDVILPGLVAMAVVGLGFPLCLLVIKVFS